MVDSFNYSHLMGNGSSVEALSKYSCFCMTSYYNNNYYNNWSCKSRNILIRPQPMNCDAKAGIVVVLAVV